MFIVTLDKHVDVVEDGRSGVHVRNATYKRVADAAECTSVFRQGLSNRTKGQTDFETRATVFFSLDLSMVSEFKQIYNDKVYLILFVIQCTCSFLDVDLEM